MRARVLVLGCGVTFRFHTLLGSRLPSQILHTAQIEVATSGVQRLSDKQMEIMIFVGVMESSARLVEAVEQSER